MIRTAPRPFPARYRGLCAADCHEPIEPGDDVRFVEDDELMHADCADQADDDALRAERAEPTVCGSCWTVHAGECL